MLLNQLLDHLPVFSLDKLWNVGWFKFSDGLDVRVETICGLAVENLPQMRTLSYEV